jgi:hypothetical protein
MLAALSFALGPDAARAAAVRLLDAPDPEATLDALYPGLVRHKALYPALLHLEAAGGDLGALHIAEARFRSTYPVNRVLPPLRPGPGQGDGITLAAIRAALERHAALLRSSVLDLARATGPDALVLVTGQAFATRYPGFPRWSHDADLFVADADAALRGLDALCDGLGFVMHGCRVGSLHGEGNAILKTFAIRQDHELNVGLTGGAQPSAFVAHPLAAGPVAPRAERLDVDGMALLVCSPEDMLLMTALRPVREGYLTLRGFGDARCLAVAAAEPGTGFDWDHVCRSALADRLNGTLWHLLAGAESAEGRDLVPGEVKRALRPGRTEAWLLARQPPPSRAEADAVEDPRPSPARRRAAKASVWLWNLRFLRARLGTVGAVRHWIGDRTALRAFNRAVRDAREGRRPWPSARRGPYRSLCELREAPAPPEVGFCLSRLPEVASGRSTAALDGPLRRLVGRLPAHGEEDALRKWRVQRTASQGHRCEAFVVRMDERDPLSR